jgi:hypothetical protein
MTNVLPSGTSVVFAEILPKFAAPLTLQITGIVGDQQPADISATYKREETYSIACQLTSYAGDQDFLARISEVFAAWELITLALWGDPTLDGAVRFAQPGGMDFRPIPDFKGQSIGLLLFEVRCEQRIDASV